MYIDDVLREKYRVQAEISKENDFDINKIAEEASKTVKELSEKFNIKLNYLDADELDIKDTA